MDCWFFQTLEVGLWLLVNEEDRPEPSYKINVRFTSSHKEYDEAFSNSSLRLQDPELDYKTHEIL